MTNQAQQDNYKRLKEQAAAAQALPLHYIGGEVVVADGEADANVPADATAFRISARGGSVNFVINGTHANPTSAGYVAENTSQVVGPLDNFLALGVYGAGATVYAHILYFREM